MLTDTAEAEFSLVAIGAVAALGALTIAATQEIATIVLAAVFGGVAGAQAADLVAWAGGLACAVDAGGTFVARIHAIRELAVLALTAVSIVATFNTLVAAAAALRTFGAVIAIVVGTTNSAVAEFAFRAAGVTATLLTAAPLLAARGAFRALLAGIGRTAATACPGAALSSWTVAIGPRRVDTCRPRPKERVRFTIGIRRAVDTPD